MVDLIGKRTMYYGKLNGNERLDSGINKNKLLFKRPVNALLSDRTYHVSSPFSEYPFKYNRLIEIERGQKKRWMMMNSASLNVCLMAVI